MTPKEKAEKLIEKYNQILPNWEDNEDAKQCALIAINEMIRICYDHHMASYYGEVRQEIEKL